MRLLVIAALIAGCAAPAPPGPGSTWTIDAVDRAGVFGTVTIERGAVIGLPAQVRRAMGGAIPGATHLILVHVEYEPDRAQDAGIGAIDWGATTGDADIAEAQAGVRIVLLTDDVEWPVEPALGMQLPGVREPLAGWLAIAVTPAELAGEVSLYYQPALVDRGGAVEAMLVSEVVIHDP